MKSTDTYPLIAIVGPTSSGKTETAILVAEKIDAEIISVDSRQVYKGMEIGTGAPSRQQLKRIVHHLIACMDPHERISAGDYADKVHGLIEEIQSRGKKVLLTGGSGLYLRAVLEGLSPIPAPNIDLRSKISRSIDVFGMEYMIGELSKVDPKYADKVGMNDRKRLIRALEVFRQTGKSFSDWHEEVRTLPDSEIRVFGLNRSRAELHKLIAQRVRTMFDMGWVEETKTLLMTYGIESLPLAVTEAIGYNFVLEHLNNSCELDEAIENTIIKTRQFLKRQMTWFRADKCIEWLDGKGDNASVGWAAEIIMRLKMSEIEQNRVEEKI